MKPRLLTLLLAALVMAASFAPANETTKPLGSFLATLDGQAFQTGNNELYRGVLVNKPGSMDGRIPERVVISSTFNGPPNAGSGEQIFTESIQFEIDYATSKQGAAPGFNAMLKHQFGSYTLLKEQSKITITNLVWEEDKKHFNLSADFNCKMRSVNHPGDNKPDKILKGKMNNIRITVPSTLALKAQL